VVPGDRDDAVYPFSIPAIAALDRIETAPGVTFIVGENGSGKSTLVEAIAISAGLNPEGGSHTSAGDPLQDDIGVDPELEAAPTGAHDTDRCLALVEAALEQDEAALKVVPERRELEGGVEAGFPIGEGGPAGRDVLGDHLPQQAAGHALDEVVVVDERAAVGGVEANGAAGP
jgi:energy-coupling factor transporter ATP-binding protein EcfA2